MLLLELQIKWITSFQLSRSAGECQCTRTGTVCSVRQISLKDGAFPWSAELLTPTEWCSTSQYWPNICTCQFTVLLPVPTGWHLGRRHTMLQWAWRLGHADYLDRLFWRSQWKTNLGTSSSPVLHKTSRIFINLNLLFVKCGGCWPTGFNIIEHLTDQWTDKQQGM